MKKDKGGKETGSGPHDRGPTTIGLGTGIVEHLFPGCGRGESCH